MKAVAMRASDSGYRVSGYPELAVEWHPTKNGTLTPDDVSYGSGRRVWWKCPKGPDHEWRASPNARTSNGTGCPFCAGIAVSVTNSLAAVAPDLVAEWHPRNASAPDAIVAFSTRPVWWRCPAGEDHEWTASPNERLSHGAGCPFCAGRRASRTNCLAVLAPAVASDWHPTRNGVLTAYEVTAKSSRRVWWRCPEGHEWFASIVNRVRLGSRCPSCEGKRSSSR